jgi:hypothetical protein
MLVALGNDASAHAPDNIAKTSIGIHPASDHPSGKQRQASHVNAPQPTIFAAEHGYPAGRSSTEYGTLGR